MNADPVRMPPSSPSASTSRIECTFDNDQRLMASLGAIFAHASMRAGLQEKTHEDVASAASDLSREMVAAAGKGSSPSRTKIVVEEFSDRLEVTIEASAGAKLEGIGKQLEGKAADRIRSEGREGRVRVTLLKSCGTAKSGSGT